MVKFIHTSDWHIGQTLNGWARDTEHRSFLDQLGELIVDHDVDALIVAGDVFDGINPSADSQRMLYGALAGFRQKRVGLQTIVIAGNHDPAGRLEAPEAVLRAIGVHVVGTIHRRDGMVDMDRHLLPIADATGEVRAQVLAIPFLRAADLPGLSLADAPAEGSPIVTATRTLHLELAEAARSRAGESPIVVTGHLHCAGGLESEGAERRILVGGEHAVPPEIYGEIFAYVALGHLHRAQNLDGGRVRYSGSPFPLSATEIGYDHGVTLVELDGHKITTTHLPLERPVPCLRIPETGALTPLALEAVLVGLGLDASLAKDRQPFAYVTLAPDGASPVVLSQAEEILDRYPLRCAGIRIERPTMTATMAPSPPSLAETTPEDLFTAAFEQFHGTQPNHGHLAAFRDAVAGE